MQLDEFKKQYVQQELGISPEFGRILTFIDFGNVNYWFEEDRQNFDYTALKDNEKLAIDIQKLKDFLNIFSEDIRFYYGHDPANEKSVKFIHASNAVFGKHRVFSKPMQKIRHYLETPFDESSNTRTVHQDGTGRYVLLPKCNFDVEIAVDAIKVLEHYDTICLLSGDADFVYLLQFLKKRGKRVILMKAGHVVHQLKHNSLVINAQDIKKHITQIKAKTWQ